MELWIIASLTGLAGLGIGAFLGHSLGVSKATAAFASAKAGLSADEQAVVDWWRKVTGKGAASPVGGGGGTSTGTATITITPTTPPPTSPSS